MKAIVLGMGQQGKAVVHDLEQSKMISKIFVADIFKTENSLNNANDYLNKMGYSKTQPIRLDILHAKDLVGTYLSLDVNVVICMLPIELALTTARAALDAGIPFVSSNYTYDLKVLDDLAKEKGVVILPEMGLDPGIDLALLRVEAWGIKNGDKVKITYDLIDYRDFETGLFAMNRTVGFTSSIGAQMILEGKITQPGVLSPVKHVPPHEFIEQVKKRGMTIDYKIEQFN